MKKNYLLFSIFSLLLSVAHAQTEIIREMGNEWDFSTLEQSFNFNGDLYFVAEDGTHGHELWRTDGTPAGTVLVKDINPGLGDGVNNFAPAAVGSVFFFVATNGTNGYELWKSDGTEAGTVMVKDLNAGSVGSNPGGLTNNNGVLYFMANFYTLCKSDGTEAGTVGIRTFDTIYEPYAFQGKVYFAARDFGSNSPLCLWRSNGTYSGTVLVKGGIYLPSHFQKVGSTLYFTTSSVNEGEELWKTDGTNNGTVIVKDINPGTGNGVMNFYGDNPGEPYGAWYYFQANDGVHGWELWRTDGTEANTTRLTDIVAGPNSSLQSSYDNIHVAGNSLVFRVTGENYFWKYTPSTSTLAPTLYRNGENLNQKVNMRFNGTIQYSILRDTIYGYELWTNNGLPGGEKRVQELVLKNNFDLYFNGQGLLRLGGFLGDTAIFMNVRPLDSPALRRYAPTAQTCFAPTVVQVVKLSPTLAHAVWNRQPGAAAYQLRYRIQGNPTWITRTSTKSYYPLNNLNGTATYEYELRTDCGGAWTAWSPTATFNLSAAQTYPFDYAMLAERNEAPTIERMYWYQGDEVVRIQIRYRPLGSATWVTTTSTNGYKRLTGLQPETLYEYQYRPYYAGSGYGSWLGWNYFFTAPDSEYFGPQAGEALALTRPDAGDLVYPNPAPQGTSLNFRYLAASDGNATLSIFEGNGRRIHHHEVKVTEGENLLALPTESLAAGVYFLRLQDGKEAGKAIRFTVQ